MSKTEFRFVCAPSATHNLVLPPSRLCQLTARQYPHSSSYQKSRTKFDRTFSYFMSSGRSYIKPRGLLYLKYIINSFITHHPKYQSPCPKKHTISCMDDFSSLLHTFMASTQHFLITHNTTHPAYEASHWTDLFSPLSRAWPPSFISLYNHNIFLFIISIFPVVYLFSLPRVTYKKAVVCPQ